MLIFIDLNRNLSVRSFIRFIVRYHVFFLFLILESLSLYFIYEQKTFHRQKMLAVTGDMSGRVQEIYSDMTSYLVLGAVNDSLMSEMAKLKMIARQTEAGSAYPAFRNDTIDSLIYRYIPARVIRSDYTNFNNYIVINKGSLDSVHPGMGVTSNYGVVGIVVSSSPHFSRIMSLLHHDIQISARLAKNGQLASLVWEGHHPQRASLRYLTYPSPVAVGDTIVTAGSSTYFPAGELLGTVEKLELEPGADFYKITVKLSTPFDRLHYVYLIDNALQKEQQILEEGL